MHVIETFLPLQRKDGSPSPSALFGQVSRELAAKFGGLTAYSRAPAEGLWKRNDGSVDRDSIVIFEIMAAELDRDWWRAFRARLETLFEQDSILIRAAEVEQL